MRLKKINVMCFVATFFAISAYAQSEGFKTSNQNKFDSSGNWSYHFQLTSIYQTHPDFSAKVSGPNSLSPFQEEALSLTTTIFIGRKLWKNAAFYFNPEISGGKGLSGVLGMGGAFNGETFKIGSVAPTPYVARAYLQQHIAIGTSKRKEYFDNEINQVKEVIPASRITINAGKFCIADFFDDNKYSHDPRTQFMNWSLMSGTGWDYPANTRGYTWGIVVEYIKPTWAARIASTTVPLIPNGMWFDWNVLQAHSETFEVEKKLIFNNRKGKIRALVYHTSSRAPSYRNAVNQMAKGDSTLLPIFAGLQQGIAYGGVKYGWNISFDQELFDGIAMFARASYGDGHSSIWAFTEVDQSAHVGLSFEGKKWKRPQDVFGIAYVVDGISQDHIDYLNAGGLTFMLGDGKGNLNYQPEQIMETFYNLNLTPSLWLTADYQLAFNPGYNKDRGPVNVFGLRVHIEF